jgi:hypothetical protein
MQSQIGEEDLREFSRWVLLDTLYIIENGTRVKDGEEKHDDDE